MAESVRLWDLEGFDQQMTDWIMREDPDEDRRVAVAEWIPTFRLDPKSGARRDPNLEATLWRKIPHTSDGHTVVICAYQLDEGRHVVKCVLIGTTPADV